MCNVSIIIPVYNAEKYLRECLDSVINQTLKNIEIICINDGSTDSSLYILNEYSQKDNRIKIINQENRGQAYSRNLGIKVAIGEYILFVDSDDFIDLSMCKKMYEYAIELSADMVECHSTPHSNGKNLTAKLIVNEKTLYNKNTINIFNGPYFATWAKLIKRNLIIENDILFFSCKMGEDQIFTLKSRYYSNIIVVVPDCLYFYRWNEQSIRNNYLEDTMFVFDLLEDIKLFLKKNNVFEKYEENYKTLCIKNLIGNYYRTKRNNLKEYDLKIKSVFSNEFYKKYLEERKPIKLNFLQKIFSVKNVSYFTIKYKYITIFGFSIRIRKQ